MNGLFRQSGFEAGKKWKSIRGVRIKGIRVKVAVNRMARDKRFSWLIGLNLKKSVMRTINKKDSFCMIPKMANSKKIILIETSRKFEIFEKLKTIPLYFTFIKTSQRLEIK